jgi:hypothetical protein
LNNLEAGRLGPVDLPGLTAYLFTIRFDADRRATRESKKHLCDH